MTSGQILSKIAVTHLSAQTELDLIHQDESVWHDGLWPVQHHTALNLVTPLVHHLPRDVICSNWETQTYPYYKTVSTKCCKRRCHGILCHSVSRSVSNLQVWSGRRRRLQRYSGPPPHCRHGGQYGRQWRVAGGGSLNILLGSCPLRRGTPW